MTVAHVRPFIAFIVLASSLVAVEAWIGNNTFGVEHAPFIAAAMAADLVIGLPLLYFLLLVRGRRTPTISLIPVSILALLALRSVIPPAYRSHLDPIYTLIPLAELILIAVVLFKTQTIIRHVRQTRNTEIYVTDALRIGVKRALGSSWLSTMLAAEIAIVYFAILGWFRRFRLNHPNATAFTYHRHGGFHVILFALLFLSMVEAGLVHLLVSRWSELTAWILTGLNGYVLLWILGYYQSARLQPTVIDPAYLHIRTGMHWRVKIRCQIS